MKIVVKGFSKGRISFFAGLINFCFSIAGTLSLFTLSFIAPYFTKGPIPQLPGESLFVMFLSPFSTFIVSFAVTYLVLWAYEKLGEKYGFIHVECELKDE